MNSGRKTISSITLLCVSVIWGLSFTAQKEGMRFIGPMLFNGIRFFLGALALLPVLLLRRKPAQKTGFWPLLAGLALFVGAGLQQIGIVHTTAGNAGFITGLYIVLVPVLGIFLGQKIPLLSWFALLLSVPGLFLLSVGDGLRIGTGDLLVLASALFWAIHVLIIGHSANRYDTIRIAVLQYGVCAVLSIIAAFLTEEIHAPAVLSAAPAIFYGGIVSVGVAYTLQIVGQKHAHPAHAAIILALEGLFAALGGYLFLREMLSPRQFAGAALMLGAVLISQFGQIRRA